RLSSRRGYISTRLRGLGLNSLFFFSSRRRHTRWPREWSSDVCSSDLVGACYVLDEPTIGLHQRDNDRLIRTLRHLTDIGNTVLVVEHDEDTIRAADHVLDIGPGPGVHGGRVVAQGTVADLVATPGSITGDYLANPPRRRIEVPRRRRAVSEKNGIGIKNARQNNL